MIVVLVLWCVEIVRFYFSEGLRILTRKPGVREETGFWRNCLPVHDVMRSFFEGFATISSLSMTSCAVSSGGTQLSSRQPGCESSLYQNNYDLSSGLYQGYGVVTIIPKNEEPTVSYPQQENMIIPNKRKTTAVLAGLAT